jgi:hypothetical protein
MKIRVCICGLTNETRKVNRNRYHNNISWTTIGFVCVAGGLPVFIVLVINGEQVSAQTWLEVSVGILLFTFGTIYRAWRINAYLKKGHNLWCAVRASFIGVA